MAERNAVGNVGLVPKGRWSASALYSKLAVVRYGTGVYIAKQPNINVEPSVNANWESYWMLAASDGGNIGSVTSGEAYVTEYNYTATPVTIETGSGGAQTFEILAKNGNAGVNILTRTVTLSANGWTGSASPYSQMVSVAGVTQNSLNFLTPATDATIGELETIYNANFQDGGQAANSITVLCFGDVPDEDVTLRVIVVLPSSGAIDIETIYQQLNNTEYGGDEQSGT